MSALIFAHPLEFVNGNVNAVYIAVKPLSALRSPLSALRSPLSEERYSAGGFMIAPVANPRASPAGSHNQNCVIAPMTIPITAPMMIPTMICLRRACGDGWDAPRSRLFRDMPAPPVFPDCDPLLMTPAYAQQPDRQRRVP